MDLINLILPPSVKTYHKGVCAEDRYTT